MPQQNSLQIKDKRNHPFCIVEIPFLLDEGLSTHDKMIYVVLCSFASVRNQKCYPSVPTIAGRASCSERQVRRSLLVLEECGYIEREFAVGHATTYSILDIPERAATQTGGTVSPDTPAPQSGGAALQSGDPGHTVRHNNTSNITKNNIREQEKDSSPSGRGNCPAAAKEPEKESPTENLPVSEAPEAMRQTADYLLLKTGRSGLKESEISELRKLDAAHYPAVVQRVVDQAVDRFKRDGRDLRTLDFFYIADTLRYRKPTRDPTGRKKAPQAQVSEPDDDFAGMVV